MNMSDKYLYGDWDKVGRWLNAKATTIDKFGVEPLKECAELYYDNIKKCIEEQKVEWASLNEVYLQKKIALGLDERILIATGSYLDGIIIGEVTGRMKSKVSIFVGANPQAIHAPSGLPMSYLGAIHEYGTRDGRIPARPHYRPAWLMSRNDCRNIWLRHFREYMRVK